MNDEKHQNISNAVVIFACDHVNAESNIDLCQLAAAVHASQLVLEVMFPEKPTTEQVLMLANAAAINDLKNTLQK
jgi:hypothetical protein